MFKNLLRHCYESKKQVCNSFPYLEKKFREIIKYFSIDLNAVQIKELTGLSRQTINKYLTAIRLRIEVDESYFGARRVRGKRGRGALGKTIVFGLLKRGDKV